MGAGRAFGFFGKLPARGDFVRAGLPRGFLEPWDDWLGRSLAAARTRLGERFLPAWLEAPVWRFALPAGACGPDGALGIWLPSVDAAGRHFPLTIVAVGSGLPAGAAAGAWLDAAAAAGIAAIAQDVPPDSLAAQLATLAPLLPDAVDAGPATAALWWTDGAPLVPPAALLLAGLPEATAFVRMLDAEAAADAAA